MQISFYFPSDGSRYLLMRRVTLGITDDILRGFTIVEIV